MTDCKWLKTSEDGENGRSHSPDWGSGASCRGVCSGDGLNVVDLDVTDEKLELARSVGTDAVVNTRHSDAVLRTPRRVHAQAEASACCRNSIEEKDSEDEWWRRRELNPRPKMLLARSLHAYSSSCLGHYPKTFAAPAQNGQETGIASL